MDKIRVRPRTRETVLKDEYGNDVPYSNGDGSLGILVDSNSTFWARRLREKDAVEVSEEDNTAAVSKLAAAIEAENKARLDAEPKAATATADKPAGKRS